MHNVRMTALNLPSLIKYKYPHLFYYHQLTCIICSVVKAKRNTFVIIDSHASPVRILTQVPMSTVGRGLGLRVIQKSLKMSLLTSSITQINVNVEASGKAEAKSVMYLQNKT